MARAKVVGTLALFGILAAIFGSKKKRPEGEPSDTPTPPGPPDQQPEPKQIASLADLNAALIAAGVTNFSAEELTYLPKAHPPRYDLPPKKYVGNLIKAAVLAQEIRDRVGVPLVVSSAWRPKWYNDAVGGASNSAHIRAAAIDLNLASGHRDDATIDRFKLIAASKWLNESDFHGLGFYKSPRYRMHVDVSHKGSSGKRYWSHDLVDPYLDLARGQA